MAWLIRERPAWQVMLLVAGTWLVLGALALGVAVEQNRLDRQREAGEVLFVAPNQELPAAERMLRRMVAALADLAGAPSGGDRQRAEQQLRAHRQALTRAVERATRPTGTVDEAATWEIIQRLGGSRVRQARLDTVERLHAALATLDAAEARPQQGEPIAMAAVRRAADAASDQLAQLSEANRLAADLVLRDAATAERRLVRTAAVLALATMLASLAAAFGVASALRRRTRELAARVAEVEKVSAYKTWFIGHVSHEFRTPLSSIIGFASLLSEERERGESAQRAEYVETVLRNARHLLHVINDILNLSKVEAGTLEVTLAEIEVAEVIAAAASSLRPMAEERDIVIDYPRGPVARVVADTGRLRQVLLNLIENAIKYSPSGAPVEVRVVTAAGGTVRVEVHDQGPGIAPADRPKLFREFSRIYVAGARVAGAGLGLALSRRLAELMGAEIGVDSTPGEGSTFWVRLREGTPVPAGSEALGPLAGIAPRGRSGTVAVVDDERDITALVAAVLGRAGYRVVTDGGGAGVVERLLDARPDLILLDLNLGEQRGRDVLGQLRGHAALRFTPVVAFTASSGTDDRRQAREAGFDDYLSKPIEPEVLVAAIDEILARRGAAPPPVAADDFVAPLRERFCAGVPARLESIDARYGAGDLAGLRREVHKLRGAAGGFGFAPLSAAAAEVEELLSAGVAQEDPELARRLGALRVAALAIQAAAAV